MAIRYYNLRLAEVCKPSTSSNDPGYKDAWQGWYDVTGCGKCNDYCRWVGDSDSGGDPNIQTTHFDSFWSCRRANTNEEYTQDGDLDYVTSWVKCTHKGADSSGIIFR